MQTKFYKARELTSKTKEFVKNHNFWYSNQRKACCLTILTLMSNIYSLFRFCGAQRKIKKLLVCINS
jgi:hypothetical protein